DLLEIITVYKNLKGFKTKEIASLKRIPDSFAKIVVVRDYLKPWQDEKGITYVGIEQFLLNEDLLK
ncbi:MAG: hypothetical protein K6E75_09505, partial [Lachnospiraceae bacterium]|nr:hypothetical protein [Lachnospiraceae bacterium]